LDPYTVWGEAGKLEWFHVLEEEGVASGESGIVPDLGVVRCERGRRLAGVPSIPLRLVEGTVRSLRFEARWKPGRR
jgi:hypothetical protein